LRSTVFQAVAAEGDIFLNVWLARQRMLVRQPSVKLAAHMVFGVCRRPECLAMFFLPTPACAGETRAYSFAQFAVIEQDSWSFSCVQMLLAVPSYEWPGTLTSRLFSWPRVPTTCVHVQPSCH
jgi:hypothetical protein